MDDIRAYLTEPKNRSGMSRTALEKATGISESAIRKIFSGETADPRFGTVQSPVNVTGGSMGAPAAKRSSKRKPNTAIFMPSISRKYAKTRKSRYARCAGIKPYLRLRREYFF